MEISFDSLLSILGLFVGGSGGAFFMWKWQKRKAKAEAIAAEVDATKDMQDLYQQMLADANTYLNDAREKVEGLRQERDHYKQDRDELRDRVEKLQKSIFDWRDLSEKERSDMKRDIAKLGRKVEIMAPFMCGDLTCKLRQRVTISEDGVVRSQGEPKDIEPLDQKDM